MTADPVAGQFENLGTKDHAQQEMEKAVSGDAIPTPKDYEAVENYLCPGGEFIDGS